MTTATKRWLVRECRAGGEELFVIGYQVHVGRRPYLNRWGRWVSDKHFTRHPAMHVERLLARKWHLKPGGGPVELKG